MTRSEQIEQEVRKTLQELEHRTPIACSPFFATRVLAGIRELEARQRAYALRPVFGLGYLRTALLALIVALNIASAIIVLRGSPSQAVGREQYLTAFADESAFNQTAYDLSLLNAK